MAIDRVFLDWNQPALPAAAKLLIDQHQIRSQGLCDLQKVLCVLPGGRAGRLLLAHVITQCKQRHLQLLPPTVVTPGSMVDRLLDMCEPLASEVESQWAWAEALRRADRQSVRSLLPHRPDDDDWRGWYELAKLVGGLHEQLAGARLQFTDAAQWAQRLEMLSEADRWLALHNIKQSYLATLKEHGLCDVHDAREAQAKQWVSHQPGNGDDRIVLIGVAELNELQRAAAHAHASRTTALVHAPAELADRFDELGCAIPDKWAHIEIGLGDDQITIADRPTDQAQQTLRAVASLEGRYSAGEITIGLGNPELVAAMQHAGEWAGLTLRSAEGGLLSHSPPCRALEAIALWLRDSRFAHLAAMLRHPDIEQWVWTRTREADAGVADWLSLLDRYFADHLHERITDEWLGDDATRARLQTVHEAMCELLAPLLQKPITRNVGQWCQPILDVLTNLYEGGSKVNSGDPARRQRIDACTMLRDVLAQFVGAPEKLQPRVDAWQAIELALDAIDGQSIPDDLQHDQIEMLGWLELHLDDAPALIIAGFNEGDIPQSISADLFLPDSLRSALGLSCNASRYARDAYLIEAMRRSRIVLKVIAGRTTAQGEPLTPSRLLLACENEALVQRVAHFCGEAQAKLSPAAPIGLHGLAAVESKFVVPALPVNLPQRESMSITEFRIYLACPYRYALAKLLRLEALDDSATELDALQFGNLAHDVLCEFGRDGKVNASTDAEHIERQLFRILDSLTPTKFGKTHLPAIAVQLARLQQRLRSFAKAQAELNAEGWRIQHCEIAFDGNVLLDIPGQEPMPLRGKIDRIDFHDEKGWRIIDYKTGESAISPHKSHHNCERVPDIVPEDWEWQDLQLPLYRYLAQTSAIGIDGDISLAYICLPKQSDGVRLAQAQWPPHFLAHALDTARDVVRDIRAGKFEINPDFGGRFDDFARICQTAAFLEREDESTVEVEA